MVATTFLHASDLHLGNFQYSNPERARDFLNALDQIFSIALEKKVDFILFGGDIFNSHEMLPYLFAEIIETFQKFHVRSAETIPIYAIEGNHDLRKMSRGQRIELLDERPHSWVRVLAKLNLITLLDNGDGDLCAFRVKNCRIFGLRYTGSQTEIPITKICEKIALDPTNFTILLMHFGVQGQMSGVPGVPYRDLFPLHERIDYLGLGHFHLNFALQGWIYNPGAMEPCAAIESTFRRGIYYVNVNDHDPRNFTAQLIPLQNRPYLHQEIEISERIANLDVFLTKIVDRIRIKIQIHNYPKPPVLSITIKGISQPILSSENLVFIRTVLLRKLPVVEVNIHNKLILPTSTAILDRGGLSRYLHQENMKNKK
jgi:DNA repair exonuclease SbcCD nuclease subunit